jgi:hypothetical protein
MEKAEVIGYVQIIVGLVGIVLTLINVKKLVPDIELFTNQKGAPPGLDNFAGFVRILTVTTILALMIFLVCVGFSVTLSTAYEALGAKFPLLSASLTIFSLISFSTTVTIALYRNRFWVAGLVGTLGCGLCALVAAVNSDIGAFWGTMAGFLIIFAVTGVGTLISFLE